MTAKKQGILKRERDLHDEDRLNLDGWTKNYPTLGDAYRLKEGFYGIYEAETPEDAMRRHINIAPGSRIP